MKNRFYTVSDKTTDIERAFYASKNTWFNNIIVSGPADGESAFKESKEINVTNSQFYLRYPLWHIDDLGIDSCMFTSTCRAPLWYCNDIKAFRININGVKAFRECNKIDVKESVLFSEEIFWNCNDVSISNCNICGFYAFFGCKDVSVEQSMFKGKYAFQYVKNLKITNTNLDTKDAFWHSKNATIEGCTIDGEYLGWYSEGLTLINCHIKGTQPLCYCKKLKIVNCSFENCDLAFEYSEVDATIIGGIDSIKNPLKGTIRINREPVMIIDENDKSNGQFELIITK